MLEAIGRSIAVDAWYCNSPALDCPFASQRSFGNYVYHSFAAQFSLWHGLMLLLVRNRSKRASAGLALKGVGIQPPQRAWRVHMTAVWAGPSGRQGKFRTALVHSVLHAISDRGGLPQRRWLGRIRPSPSQAHRRLRSAWRTTHPA